MQLDTLKRENPNKKSQPVGRGGTRGKTSGRGMKGQKARAGRKIRPQIRDIIKKFPKLRGYRFNSHAGKIAIVNISDLNVFEDGSTINSQALLEKGLVDQINGGLPKVKILGNGELKVKINVEGCILSKSAQEKIEKTGGTIK